MNQTPYTRNSLRMPEQFLHKLNRQNRQLEAKENTVVTFDKDGKTAIIQGIQPDGTFGIKKYQVNGDILVLVSTVI